MNDQTAKQILDKVMGQIFGFQNPFSLDQFQQKYAFDVRLPSRVNDSTTDEETWAQSTNPTKFITLDNVRKHFETSDGLVPKKPLNSIEDILNAWNDVNLTATERQIDSINFAKSDNVYYSENVYHSQDINQSKNILFCDGINGGEYLIASQRSQNSSFCVRLEDSKECSNSFEISWSAKAVNSLFLHDCYDMYESMFCSHVASKKFCVANMQFEESEYRKLKEQVVQWVLTN